MARALRFAVLAAGLAVGVFSLAVARGGAGYSFGGGSAFAGIAELAAGYALLGVGLAAWMRPRQAGLGAILVAASFAWFLLEWNNPAAGSAPVFTIGLVLYAAAPPLVAHAMLAYPDGRVGWWPGRLGLALGYAGSVLVLGLLAAAAFNPAAQGCARSPQRPGPGRRSQQPRRERQGGAGRASRGPGPRRRARSAAPTRPDPGTPRPG